jgi:type IV pilus assembly protein PilW
MNALYGVDTNNDGVQDAWAGPGDAGWDIASVMASPNKMRQIISVRIALIVRGEYYDKKAVSPTSLTIFRNLTNAGGTSLSQSPAISGADLHYRYRVFEFTVPLRNMLIRAGDL